MMHRAQIEARLVPVKDWMPADVRAGAKDRKLKAGEVLFRIGDKTIGLCEVIAGRVRLARVDRSGHEVVLHVAGAGETLAEAALFSPQYHCDAIASTKATVRVYPKREVLAAFERNPKAARAFSAALAHQVMDLRTRIEQRNIRSARERVRHFLALNTKANGRVFELRGTLKDLAAELGLTHEALYRTLAALERSGEIRRNHSKITLLPRMIEIICWLCGLSYSGHQGHNAKEAPDVKTSMEDNACRDGSPCRDCLCLRTNAVRRPNGHAWSDGARRHDEPNAWSDDAGPRRNAWRHGNARRYGRSWRNAWPTICRDRHTDHGRARCLRNDPRDRSNSTVRSQDRLVKGQR
jgi:CRP-like cAMP-binding protein